MSDVKRLNYFNNQFLEERDFRDEQSYHLEMRHRHNRHLHSWGVVNGLGVERAGHDSITIQPGMAIDAAGREIVLEESVRRELPGHAPNSHVYLAIRYEERFAEEDRQGEGPKSFTRVTEVPEIETHHQKPPADGGTVVLARVQFDQQSHIREIDTGERKYATAVVGARSVGTEELQDFAVTEQKLSEDLRSRIGRAKGWVRLPFKPLPIERVRIDDPNADVRDVAIEFDTPFISAIGYARAGRTGARGTMGIPIPVGARRIRGLRLIGWTKAMVEFSLFRTGWRNDRCEEAEIHAETTGATNQGYFNHYARLDHKLEDEDGLVIVVGTKAPARIFLVCAEFE